MMLGALPALMLRVLSALMLGAFARVGRLLLAWLLTGLPWLALRVPFELDRRLNVVPPAGLAGEPFVLPLALTIVGLVHVSSSFRRRDARRRGDSSQKGCNAHTSHAVL